MTKLKVGMIVIAPEITADYLTPGKEYIIIELWGVTGKGFMIYDDNHRITYCRIEHCANLTDNDWIIKPETTPQ